MDNVCDAEIGKKNQVEIDIVLWLFKSNTYSLTALI